MLVLGANCAEGQEIKTFYFNEHMQPVNDTLAPISGLARRQGETWEIVLVEAASGAKLLYGYFDSSLTKPVGPCTYYFSNGARRLQGYYHNGLETGYWRTWNTEGQLIDSTRFEEGQPKEAFTFLYYDDGPVRFTTYTDSTGRKVEKTYTQAGVLTFESKTDGKAVTMRGFDAQGTLLYEYIRDAQGKVVKDSRPGINKGEVHVNAAAASGPPSGRPEFPGGEQAFHDFILREVQRNNEQYYISVRVDFDLDEKGLPRNIKTSEITDATAAQRLMSAIRRMPQWHMNGYRTFHVSYTLTL
ncbi:hypothetical protein GCM10028786_06890 [Flaviaesturariibacter terrae]